MVNAEAGGGGAKMTSAPMQQMLTKLVPVSQPMQFLPQPMPLIQTQSVAPTPPKEKAAVVPLPPLLPQVQEPPKAASPDAAPTSDDAKDADDRSSSPDAADEEEETTANDERGGEKLKALVKPQVLTHVIEGFVIQEGIYLQFDKYNYKTQAGAVWNTNNSDIFKTPF